MMTEKTMKMTMKMMIIKATLSVEGFMSDVRKFANRLLIGN